MLIAVIHVRERTSIQGSYVYVHWNLINLSGKNRKKIRNKFTNFERFCDNSKWRRRKNRHLFTFSSSRWKKRWFFAAYAWNLKCPLFVLIRAGGLINEIMALTKKKKKNHDVFKIRKMTVIYSFIFQHWLLLGIDHCNFTWTALMILFSAGIEY